MNNFFRALPRKLCKPCFLILGVIVAALITGGILFYQEWRARQPMDFALPEPVASATGAQPAATPTDMASAALSPGITPGAAASTQASASPPPSAQASAVASSASAATQKLLALKEDEIGVLYVGKKKIAVKRGVDEATLKKHVGWMETSVMPGKSGVCVLMGHRDKELKNLQNIKAGSVLTVETSDGAFAYTVYNMEILDKDTPAQIPATTEAELMILTCYPFYYSGSAPQQLVIRARQ